MLSSRRNGLSVIWIALALNVAAISPGLAQQSNSTSAPAGKNGVVTAANRAANDSAPTMLPPVPASPARVSLANGLLTVDAKNSDLSQILQEIARVTGMSVTGLNGNRPVFGEYGPGDPRSVLTSLLEGSGYNFLLVGSGAVPRQLVLTPETKAPPVVAKAAKPDPPDEYEEQYAEQDSSDPY